MMGNLASFRNVDDGMLWKGAALQQIEEFEKLADRLGLRSSALSVVGSHRSKSISLPVVEISLPEGTFTMRDNFYDTNLLVELEAPCQLTLAEFYDGVLEPRDWAWYLEQIDRARGYSWREWTDEEMNDPRILRVRDKRPGCDMWWDKKPGEKERWAKRLTDPEWYRRDWSSGELTWDGEFGPGVTIFSQHHPFAEGISAGMAPNKYAKGMKEFIIAVGSIEQAGTLIQRIASAAKGQR